MENRQETTLTGSRIGRYAIGEIVGAGGMGHVYRAHDQTLERDVAIKILRPPSGAGRGTGQRLALEARALSRVNHPCVAGIYDFFNDAGRDVLVMEYVPGMTLKELLARGPLPLEEVVRLGRQILEGVAAAHAAHVVHHDIKPANVMVTASGQLKILDFGLARILPADPQAAADTTRSAAMTITGTIPYMSPEQLCGLRSDRRSDIFSVGTVLYELATGVRAFPQQQVAQLIEAILHREPVRPSSLGLGLPRAFDRVIARAVAKQPRARFQTAAALDRALAKVPIEPTGGLERFERSPSWWR